MNGAVIGMKARVIVTLIKDITNLKKNNNFKKIIRLKNI